MSQVVLHKKFADMLSKTFLCVEMAMNARQADISYFQRQRGRCPPDELFGEKIRIWKSCSANDANRRWLLTGSPHRRWWLTGSPHSQWWLTGSPRRRWWLTGSPRRRWWLTGSPRRRWLLTGSPHRWWWLTGSPHRTWWLTVSPLSNCVDYNNLTCCLILGCYLLLFDWLC